MNRTYTIPKLVVFALMLLPIVTGIEAAEEPLSGFSGEVVDLEGNRVTNFTFAIRPVTLHNGFMLPADEFLPWRTDSTGAFTVSDIQPGFVQLSALPDIPLDVFDSETEFIRGGKIEPDKKIVSIQIGKVTFFNIGDPDFYEGLTFALKPGENIENVKVIVKPRLRIRGRVVYADGAPLANAELDFDIGWRHETRLNHSGNSGAHPFTDADGYFVQYVDEPGFYTLSMEYRDLSAGAGPFLLKDSVQPEEIVFTLEGKPDVVELPPPKIKAPGKIKFQEPSTSPTEGVWIINPANGHAYKRIQCEDWHDAQRKAVEEGAHLVSINDESEQHWVQVIFGGQPFWIGLTDAKKEGEWQWDSGEPVTYTNWVVHPIARDKSPDTEKDYVVFTFIRGEWQAISPKSLLWEIAKQAVIEKDGLVSTINE
ncbi:MAG: lectin-like protein [Candidatus Poribacteria bacterium]|nr:lectin-like protein [Candidatus Poribacteria bacterium]